MAIPVQYREDWLEGLKKWESKWVDKTSGLVIGTSRFSSTAESWFDDHPNSPAFDISSSISKFVKNFVSKYVDDEEEESLFAEEEEEEKKEDEEDKKDE